MLINLNKPKGFFLSSIEANRFSQSLVSNVWNLARLKHRLAWSYFTACFINLH